MVTPNGVSGPHVLDTVYISEVNEARKLKSDAEVAMKKTQTPCRFFLQWLGAQCLQVIFFQTFKIGRNESSYDGKVKIYLQTKFRWDVTIHGWDIATSGFWKQTAAMLELYFRFLSSRLRHHRHVIAHQPTKFHPNRTIHDIVMTSYPFSKMAATASQFYFRFRLSWLRSFRTVIIYLQTKYRRDISIHGWDITTFGYWKQTAAMLKFYLQFRFSRLRHHRHIMCICLPNFIQIGPSATQMWRFDDGGRQPFLICRSRFDYRPTSLRRRWSIYGCLLWCLSPFWAEIFFPSKIDQKFPFWE